MKTYFLAESDKHAIKKSISTYMRKSISDFEKNPQWYGSKTKTDLMGNWYKNAISKALFELLSRDGIARIEKWDDEHYSIDFLCGDCFCPIANPDIDPEQLKLERKRYLARIRKQGVYGHTLHVLGVEHDSIGGFVGNDFIDSGYDSDFYNTAWNIVLDTESLKDYVSQIIDFIVNLPELAQ